MQEEIVVESRKGVRFERYCVRCGKKTIGRLRYKEISAEPIDSMLGIISSLANLDIWVPFCYRCKWNAFSPDRRCYYHLIAAIILIGIGVYCFAKEYMVCGAISFLFVFIELCVAVHKNNWHRKDAQPVRVHREGKKILYVFTSGHFYDRMVEKLDQESELSGGG